MFALRGNGTAIQTLATIRLRKQAGFQQTRRREYPFLCAPRLSLFTDAGGRPSLVTIGVVYSVPSVRCGGNPPHSSSQAYILVSGVKPKTHQTKRSWKALEKISKKKKPVTAPAKKKKTRPKALFFRVCLLKKKLQGRRSSMKVEFNGFRGIEYVAGAAYGGPSLFFRRG